MGQHQSRRPIYIAIQVGETQSQELFDFHSKDNRLLAWVVQEGSDITYHPQPKSCEKLLYRINYSGGQMQLQTGIHNDKSIWHVLQPQEPHLLQLGSVVKVGKVKLRLKEIVQQQPTLGVKSTKCKVFYRDEAQQIRSISNVGANTSQHECRMCFQSLNTKQNPLISLCKCSGSVKYTHYQCLKEWINNNVVKREQNNILYFSYQQTKCQICKSYFSPFFTINAHPYELLDFQKAPTPPYAIFQQIEEEESVNRHSIFLIGLSEDEITIGRNSSSTIVMKEISVSRNHCSMLYRNKELYIKDKGSKFGTLVKMEDQTEFTPAKGLKLQIQSKLIRIFEKRSLGCCCDDTQKLTLRLIKGSQGGGYGKNQDNELSQSASHII